MPVEDTSMQFRDSGIVLFREVSGPVENHLGEAGFSFMVAPTPYEKEVIIYRDELQAMLDAIDGKDSPCHTHPAQKETR